MATSETSPSLACPSLEEIAAFLEGRLEDADRERLTAHLAACESCLELVAETALFLQEPPKAGLQGEGAGSQAGEATAPSPLPSEPDPGIRPISSRRSGRSSRRLRFLPLLAAALVLAAGLGLYRQLFAPASFSSVYGSLRETDPTQIAPRLWAPRTYRSATPDDLGNLERSFRVGVRTVDLQVALAAANREAALTSTLDLLRTLQSARLVPQERKAFYEQIRKKLEIPPAEGEDLAAEARAAAQAAQDLKPLFHESFFLFGQWTEAGRLAATASSPDFFKVRKHRRFLDQVQQEKRLSPDVLAQLQEIERIWDADSLDAENFRSLEELLDEVIHLSAGR